MINLSLRGREEENDKGEEDDEEQARKDGGEADCAIQMQHQTLFRLYRIDGNNRK